MSTTTLRTVTSFRWQTSLVEELKEKAKASNRSLNNYVESLLLSILHPSAPVDANTITPELQARIDEVMREHDKGNYVRCSNKQELQAFLDSL